MPTFTFFKLVRDKIVDQQIADGAKVTYRKLDPAEHRRALIAKLHEEADELAAAKPGDIAGELADIQQVLDDLRDVYGLEQSDVTDAQIKKLQAKGGFASATYIETVEVSEDDRWTAYYRAHPDRYPEQKARH